jgi:hypothetical protein
MDQTIAENGTSTSSEKKETRRHIVFVHLKRLSWLALTVVAVLLLTLLVRNLTSSAGFFIEQQITVIAVIVGLVLVAIVYTVGVIHMLRKIRVWEHEGQAALANGALWSSGITAAIIALPIVLLFFIQ